MYRPTSPPTGSVYQKQPSQTSPDRERSRRSRRRRSSTDSERRRSRSRSHSRRRRRSESPERTRRPMASVKSPAGYRYSSKSPSGPYSGYTYQPRPAPTRPPVSPINRVPFPSHKTPSGPPQRPPPPQVTSPGPSGDVQQQPSTPGAFASPPPDAAHDQQAASRPQSQQSLQAPQHDGNGGSAVTLPTAEPTLGGGYKSSAPRPTHAPAGPRTGRSMASVLERRRHEYQERRQRMLSCFDVNDHAPEDRVGFVRGGGRPQRDGLLPVVDGSTPVVRGTLSIDGVNYSTYEAHKKERPEHADRFLDALRDDIISEVGNGVRREDILFAVTPGTIKSVVLHYDEGTPRRIARGDWVPEPPKLMTASWSFTVDYAIKARNEARQKRVADAMYQALTSDVGVTPYKTPPAYVKYLDPTHGDPDSVRIVRPVLQPEGTQAPLAAQTRRIEIDPPATRAVSPVRSAPVGDVYPAAQAPPTVAQYFPKNIYDAQAMHQTKAPAAPPALSLAYGPGDLEQQRQVMGRSEREEASLRRRTGAGQPVTSPPSIDHAAHHPSLTPQKPAPHRGL